MALSKQLKNIIKKELVEDPTKAHYLIYRDHPSQIAAMLNDSRNINMVQPLDVRDIQVYLKWLEENNQINNIILVKQLLQGITTYEGYLLLKDYVDNVGAPGLLEKLDEVGLVAFLNMFTIYYGGDLAVLEPVLRDVLIKASNEPLILNKPEVRIWKRPSRISEIFSGIPSAPNAISENDIQEILIKI